MPFTNVCCCHRHEDWGHGSASLKNLRVVTPSEEEFCKVGKWSTVGHKERRKKICVFCRNRMKLEAKCETLEKEIGSSSFEDTVYMEIDNSTSLDEEMVTYQGTAAPMAPAPLIHKLDKSCQVPNEFVMRVDYAALKERRRRIVRDEVCEKLSAIISDYTTSAEGANLLLCDVINSRKYRYDYGDFLQQALSTREESDSKILKSLARDYKASKSRETTQQIKIQQGAFSEKVLIGRTLKTSSLASKGAPEARSRTEIAKNIGRISKFGDERRRILSIVALDFSQSALQQYFNCSKSTITAARVHAILFGKGGEPRDGLTFKRQSVSPEVIREFEDFLSQDDISRPSSCRSVLVNKKETGVRYWQSSVKDIVQQYILKYPNGVKRTYIYTHAPINFRTDSMLAGLCNLCDDFGHTNFEMLQSQIGNIRNEEGFANADNVAEECRAHQKYLKLQYKKQIKSHSDVRELCRDFGFGTCTHDHPTISEDFEKFYRALDQVKDAIASISDTEKKVKHEKELDKICENHREYMAHLIRTKHQSDYYRYIKTNLKPGEIVVIVDYKMKLEMGKRLRENQREWYGKRGISIHGFYIMAKVKNLTNINKCDISLEQKCD